MRDEPSLGCILGVVVGVAGIAATFSLGPIDFSRSVYSQIVGDGPVLKSRLVDYVRQGVRRTELPNYQFPPGTDPEAELEKLTAYRLGLSLDGSSIDPAAVSIHDLWDASETYAPSPWQRFVWPDLE